MQVFLLLASLFSKALGPVQEVLDQADSYYHEAVVYVAPPFRHTHFDGKQVVVHNRRFDDSTSLHELFSYNLYPGPSAKKGVYGMLLTMGERAETPWTTAHCSTVQVVTPYENVTTIMHEGASGGGKSEMLEHMHREADGQLKLATNTVTNDSRSLALPRGCELHPVTDDMALCHPTLQGRRVSTRFSYTSWMQKAPGLFVSIISKQYGVDPQLEKLTISPTWPPSLSEPQGSAERNHPDLGTY